MTSRLYIIQCEHFFKIGFTTSSVKSRLSTMKTGNPFHINIALDVMLEGRETGHIVEQAIHKKFSKKRGLGEWFMLKDGDIEWIKTYLNKHKSFKKMTIGHFSELPAFDPSKSDYWKTKYMADIQRISRIEKDRYWQVFNFEEWTLGMRTAFREREMKILGKEVKKLQKKKELIEELEELEAKIHDAQIGLDYIECHTAHKEKYLKQISDHPAILSLTKEIDTIKNALNNVSKIRL